jgi:hypothetical protein
MDCHSESRGMTERMIETFYHTVTRQKPSTLAGTVIPKEARTLVSVSASVHITVNPKTS